ncbi:MAG: glucosaminidase domain-containing protein [Treponema sp.]|jgi:hypothetical protein|nr:glucosaminidase domain-containing protein [Treponema sp.]
MKTKYTGFLLVVLMGFTGVNGLWAQQDTIRQERIVSVPITWELVNTIRDAIEKSDAPRYYLSTTINIIPPVPKEDDYRIVNGNFVFNSMNPPDPIPEAERVIITTADPGTRNRFFDYPRGRESFEIKFEKKYNGEDVVLVFERNLHRNCFELVSIMVDNKKQNLFFQRERPHLNIHLVDSRNAVINTNSIPAPITVGSTNPHSVFQTPAGRIIIGSNTIFIEGPGSLSNRGAIVNYILRQGNPAVSRSYLEALIDTYIREAEKERINHDIAIAQMLHTTNFLRNEQRWVSYNYAGFTHTPGWSGRFRDMTEGVQAHIQHLKGYASYEQPRVIVDPRWGALRNFRGTIKTLDAMAMIWMPNDADYGNTITGIIGDLHRASFR